MKEIRSLVSRIRASLNRGRLGDDFRKYGPAMGVFEYDVFLVLADQLYLKGLYANEPGYSVVYLPDNRVAIDYQGEMRGVYTTKGKPISFYRPDYRKMGYSSQPSEIDAFRAGRNIPSLA